MIFFNPAQTTPQSFVRPSGLRNVESPESRKNRQTIARLRWSCGGKGVRPCVVLVVQNRAHPCASVAVQITAAIVNSSEICDHFLAKSNAVQVCLHRIPLERPTVDDVYTQGRWRFVCFAGWGISEVVSN